MEEYAKQNIAAAESTTKLPSPSIAESFPKIPSNDPAWTSTYGNGQTGAQPYPTSSNCNINDYHQMHQQQTAYPNNSLSVTAKYWS